MHQSPAKTVVKIFRMSTAKERQAKGFCESFLVRHHGFFIRFSTAFLKEHVNALEAFGKGKVQRLPVGSLLKAPFFWPSKSWAARCGT